MPETQIKNAPLAQPDTKQERIALRCKTLWACLHHHIISAKSFVNLHFETMGEDSGYKLWHNSWCYQRSQSILCAFTPSIFVHARLFPASPAWKCYSPASYNSDDRNRKVCTSHILFKFDIYLIICHNPHCRQLDTSNLCLDDIRCYVKNPIPMEYFKREISSAAFPLLESSLFFFSSGPLCYFL